MARDLTLYTQWLGIPREELPPNHYRLLGLAPFESRPQVIEASAAQRIAYLQPHQSGEHAEQVARLIAEISAARSCLVDPEKKVAYDLLLQRNKPAATPAAPPPVPAMPPRPAAPPASATTAASPPAGTELFEVTYRDPFAKKPAAEPVKKWGLERIAVVVTAVVLLIVGGLIWQQSAQQKAAAQSYLVLQWPEEQRRGAAIELNGQPQEVPATGPVEYRFEPQQQVAIVVKAEGYRPFEKEVFLGKGEKRIVRIPFEELALVAAPKKLKTAAPSVAQAASDNRDPIKELLQERLADQTPAAPAATEPEITFEASSTMPATEQPAATMAAETPAPEKTPATPAAPTVAGPRPEIPALAIQPDIDVDPLIDEAWKLIEQRDFSAARKKLEEAQKTNPRDIRSRFSQGLLDALVDRDWRAASRHFEDCVKREPANVPALNNLALARLRIDEENWSLSHWERAMKESGTPPLEIVQNLGRARQVVKAEKLAMSPTHQRQLDKLFDDAKSGTGKDFLPEFGFYYMPLKLASGQLLGWKNVNAFEDQWCFDCNGGGQVGCTNPDCTQGSVKGVRRQVVGRMSGGKVVVGSTATRVSCPTCKGQGTVVCKNCERGKDKTYLKTRFGTLFEPKSVFRRP